MHRNESSTRAEVVDQFWEIYREERNPFPSKYIGIDAIQDASIEL